MDTVYRGALYGAAGRRTQLFHLIFTEPRAHHKVHPCSIRRFPDKDDIFHVVLKIIRDAFQL